MQNMKVTIIIILLATSTAAKIMIFWNINACLGLVNSICNCEEFHV